MCVRQEVHKIQYCIFLLVGDAVEISKKCDYNV